MNKVLKFVFLAILVAGSAIAALSDVPMADYIGLAAAFISAAGLCVTTYKKSETKDWKVITSIILIAVGAFGLVFAGVSEDAITKIITAVGGVVLLLFGLITSALFKKES